MENNEKESRKPCKTWLITDECGKSRRRYSFQWKRSCFTFIIHQHHICNNTWYHAKHSKIARKKTNTCDRSKTFEKMKIPWANTLFLHVFRFYSTKRAKTHAKRSKFFFHQIHKVLSPMILYCTGKCKNTEKSWSTLQNKLKSI